MTYECGLRGRHRLYAVADDGARTPLQDGWTANTWAVTWGYIAARCLGLRDPSFVLSAMYIEYENPASTGDSISIPTFAAEDGLAYYAGLAGSPRRDYLRVPLRSTPALDVAPGYAAYFGPGQGNRLTVLAQTAGALGAHGRPFTAGAGSTVCGIALVAAPVLADSTQDVLFARSYYAADKQVTKPPNGQVSVDYELIFGATTPP